MTSAPQHLEAIDPRAAIAPQVHATLKRAILTLTLAPGAALSEKELSLRLGVSRTPVREALIKLADEGLVDVFPQRGSFVAPIRPAGVREAQFIREALETAVVRAAAAAPPPGLAAALQANVARQREAVRARAFDAFMQLDEDFHAAIADSLSLARVWRQIQSVKGQLDRVRYLALPDPDHLSVLCRQHAAIVEGLAAGDPDRAAAAMQVHLREVFRSVDLLVRDKPDLFEG